MLEIGTGWGELAIHAAARGAQVTTVTVSPSQWRTARRRAETAGVADRVDVQLRDYREAADSYDVVLSVEMIEAVGERYWPAYFTAIDRLLAPGGRAGLQAITMPHDRMLATRGGHTWIHKYIFPGGQIPSQPGSDYQIVSISLDAGYTRDLILMLIDVHAVLDHLYLDGTQPQITSPAEDYLRESASPYNLPALINALGEVTGQLSRAERQALDRIPPGPPASEPASSNPAASF